VLAQVGVEQVVGERAAELRVIRDPLVELEVRLDDLLDHVLELLVEGEPNVLPGVHPGAGIQGRVPIQAGHRLLQADPILLAQVDAEPFVQLGDDLGEGFQLLLTGGVGAFRFHGFELPGPALQLDPLPVCWIRYDSMSMFCWTSRGSSARSAGRSRRRCRLKT